MITLPVKNIILSRKEAFSIIAMVLFLGFFSRAFCQNTPFVQFGIKSGFTMSDLYGSDTYLLDSLMIADGLAPHARFGLPFGVSFSTRLNAYWGLGVELFYTMKGKKYVYSLTRNDVTGTLDYIFKFNYLEVPILLKFFIPGESDFNSNFYAGFSPGFLTAALQHMKIDVEGKTYLDTSSSFYNNCNTIDYGIVFGAGGFVSEETIDVTLDLRCTVGLSSVFKRQRYETEAVDIKNWQVMVLLGFVKRLSKNNPHDDKTGQ